MDLFTAENLVSFLTLSFLEIVLGIDNVIFIAILVAKLPKDKQEFTRKLGLFLAMFMRIGLLFSISWIIRLTEPLFSVLSYHVTGRDLILLTGGMFLIVKSTLEIHHKLEQSKDSDPGVPRTTSFFGILTQILLLDIVFSLDSVITAVGLAQDLRIMIAAVVLSVVIMMIFAKPVSDFIEEHPTFKVLALSFLLLIGATLVMEGAGAHVDKAYIYFAIAFSLFVEFINMKLYSKKPVVS